MAIDLKKQAGSGLRMIQQVVEAIGKARMGLNSFGVPQRAIRRSA